MAAASSIFLLLDALYARTRFQAGRGDGLGSGRQPETKSSRPVSVRHPAVRPPPRHDRWKPENNGWNDLTQNWAFKHGFLHSCRHRPPGTPPNPATSQNDDDEPSPSIDTSQHTQVDTPVPAASLVANCGLAAVSLIVLLAFTLSMAFTHCHSKLFRRYRMTTTAVACQLRRSVSKLPPKIRAPDSPAALQAVGPVEVEGHNSAACPAATGHLFQGGRRGPAVEGSDPLLLRTPPWDFR